MKKPYQFIDADQDVVGAELVQDPAHGPVIWLQTSPNGAYIPADRLDEFIAGLKKVAASEAQDVDAA